MKKLSKQKRQQLILTGLLTVLALAGLWFGVIRAQQRNLQTMAKKTEAAKEKLRVVKTSIANADQTEQQLGEARKQLDKQEELMASGDLYAWAITTIRTFKLGYKVEIPQFSQIDGPKPVELLPDFPYKEVTLTIGGNAAFHELGRFVADFENQFPHMRLLNLSLEPATSDKGEAERLSFKMEIAALVKPGAS
jgi:Tfp pilus assembly protein PilO